MARGRRLVTALASLCTFWRLAAIAGLILVILFWVFWFYGLQHWLSVQTGTYCGSTGTRYCYWSGFGSVFPWAPLSLTGIYAWIVLQYKQHNCHDPRGWLPWGCWRLGKYQAAGGQYHFCWKHHPDHQGARPSVDQMHRAHRLYLGHQPGRG